MIPRDPPRRVVFAPLQSEPGRRLLAPHGGMPADMDSMVVLEDGAILASHLNAPWPFVARLARLVPRGLRDTVYDGIARGRYRWFGRRDVCELPQANAADRFLDRPPSAP